jgi:hypothetical protein
VSIAIAADSRIVARLAQRCAQGTRSMIDDSMMLFVVVCSVAFVFIDIDRFGSQIPVCGIPGNAIGRAEQGSIV